MKKIKDFSCFSCFPCVSNGKVIINIFLYFFHVESYKISRKKESSDEQEDF